MKDQLVIISLFCSESCQDSTSHTVGTEHGLLLLGIVLIVRVSLPPSSPETMDYVLGIRTFISFEFTMDLAGFEMIVRVSTYSHSSLRQSLLL